MGGRRAFIIGGGVSGLACGDLLSQAGFQVIVFEASRRVGGMAATVEREGFRFDMGPHKLYSPMPEPMAHVKGLFPEPGSLLHIPKVSQLRFRGRSFGYPLSVGELLGGIPRGEALRFGASFVAARLAPGSENGSYADFMRRQFGRSLYVAVFGPAARKVFGEDETLSRKLGEARFRGKTLASFLSQAMTRSRTRIDAPAFHYPRRGTGDVPERLRRRIEDRGGTLHLGAGVERLEIKNRRVASLRAGGQDIPLAEEDIVIETVPLRDASVLLGLEGPALCAAKRLRYRKLLLVYLIVRRPRVMANQWMFFPTRDIAFNRLSEPKNFSPDMAPADRTSLIAEVTGEPGGAWEGPAVTRAIADLVRLKLVTEAEVESVHTEVLEAAYPVWTVGFEKDREEVLSAIDRIENLYPLGRHGLYQYVGILDCVDMAQKTSSHIIAREPRAAWVELRRRLEGYPVVD